eukprot:5589610-Prymnesium_polylepis.1
MPTARCQLRDRPRAGGAACVREHGRSALCRLASADCTFGGSPMKRRPCLFGRPSSRVVLSETGGKIVQRPTNVQPTRPFLRFFERSRVATCRRGPAQGGP